VWRHCRETWRRIPALCDKARVSWSETGVLQSEGILVALPNAPFAMQFRTLLPSDAANLLDFELANRAWFERTILPRAASIYTPDGIVAHIEHCLEEYERGVYHPSLLVDSHGRIGGRLNLKDIDRTQGTSEIGYRIAQDLSGKGWASSAVGFLQQLAYGQWALRSLSAYVTVENPASARVLEKNGFVRLELVPQRSLVQGRLLDNYRYGHSPD
jgi:ribosomal-protein-alanine N-acetyltransferase